jgi:HSP20 family molecular chaperone IbpA
MSVDTNKLIKSPEVTYDYDHKLESLLVTVELPGVEPDAFVLNIALCGFYISAKTSDIQYEGNYKFFHEVDADAAKVEFRNGTLSVRLPFFAPICGKQFPIELDID